MIFRRRKQPSPIRELTNTPDLDGKRFLFLAGLHRSGTSILHRQLREHPEISGFHDTGVPEDEGQHLQDVFPTGKVFGGPGRFAFDSASYLTEADVPSPENRARLLRQWGAHWDLSRSVLVEKSPPTLVRARFLQALFPGSVFVFIVRHPAVVATATLKWAKTSVPELVAHWHAAHARMLADLDHLGPHLVIRYEDYLQEPDEALRRIQALAGLAFHQPGERVEDRNSDYFARWSANPDRAVVADMFGGSGNLLDRFGYTWEKPYVRPWAGLS